MSYSVDRPMERCPSHPGALLADLISETGKTKVEIAKMLGLSRMHLYDIMNENNGVTANVAIRLAKLFGGDPLTWLKMQNAYDLWHAERNTDLTNIVPLEGTHVAG